MIVFGQPEGIMRVSEDGGEADLIVSADAGEDLWNPQLLPDGRVLFTVASPGGSAIAIASPDADDRVVLFPGERAVYLPTGHLVVTDPTTSPNALLARSFDLASLTFGGAVPMQEGVQVALGKTHFAVSEGGSLVYIPGTGGGGADTGRSLVWVDRNGNEEAIPLPPGQYEGARISPDGTRVVMSVGPRPQRDIWMWNITTQNTQRLTFNEGDESNPVWSPDGEEIFFVSNLDGSPTVYSISPEGGDVRTIASSEEFAPLPWSVSPDGRTLAAAALYNQTYTGISTVATTGGSDFQTLLADDPDEESLLYNEPAISPNGEWLAYEEGALTALRIYVRPFPGVQRTQVSVSNEFSLNPVWSGDGSELFYSSGDGIWAAAVEYAPFRIGTPELVFRRQYRYGNLNAVGFGGRAWDWDTVGQRFLMMTLAGLSADPDAEEATPRTEVILNWIEELKDRVPVP